MERQHLLFLVLAWIAVVAILILTRTRRKTPGVGLTIAYLLNLSLNHLIGAAIYLMPGFENQDSRLTELGFEQSAYAVFAFALGALFIAPWLLNRRHPAKLDSDAALAVEINPALPRALILCGALVFALSRTALGTLPSAAAIISTGPQLVVAGLVLYCWQAWHDRKPLRIVGGICISLLLPVVTVLTSGFLGYGVVAVLTLLTFVIGLVRSNWKIMLGGLAFTYLGLSLFVSYMRDRVEIRKSVWGEESYQNRIDRVSEMFSTFEWFDPNNEKHLERIDDRLNQNFLVGGAVRLLSETNDYAKGETLWLAVLALIPRAIWADKPIEAGSGSLVTRFTGIQFVEGTSVGIGQVMEFYANFGTAGVVLGFLIFGIVIAVLDAHAAECLNRSDVRGFLVRYLPGLSLLQVGGQLVEISASALGSLIVAVLVSSYVYRLRPTGESTLALPAVSAS